MTGVQTCALPISFESFLESGEELQRRIEHSMTLYDDTEEQDEEIIDLDDFAGDERHE